MSDPSNKVSLDKSTDTGSQATRTSGVRAASRFQVSREMKILLGFLALAGAVGGWYVLNSSTAPTDTTLTTPATPTPATANPGTTSPTTTPAPSTGTTTTPSTGTAPNISGTTGTSGAGSTTTGGSTSGSAGTTTTPGPTAGNGPVTVPEVPFLTPAGSDTATSPDGTPAAPSGINPVDPLAVVPTSNPFSPLKVVNPAATASATTPVQTQPSSPATFPANSQPSQPVASVPSLSPGGAIPLPSVPLTGIGNSNGSNSGGVTLTNTGRGTTTGSGKTTGASTSAPATPIPSLSPGGVIPLPSVPNGNLPTAGAPNTTPLPGLPTTPANTGSTASNGGAATALGSGGSIPVGNGAGSTTPANTGSAPSNGMPANGTATTPPVKPPKPVIPPVVGINSPALGSLRLNTPSSVSGLTLPGSAGGATGASQGTTGAAGSTAAGSGSVGNSGAGNGNAGNGAASDAGGTPVTGQSGSTAAAAVSSSIVQPGVVTQFGSDNAPITPPAPVVSPLDQLIQSRELVFNAVVLGPVNTAIFKTNQGFLVVPTGQTLQDSDVVLKEVTASSVTLSLGNDSKTLELDKSKGEP